MRRGSERDPRGRVAGVWEPWGGHPARVRRQVRSLSLSTGVPRGLVSWTMGRWGTVVSVVSPQDTWQTGSLNR